MKVLRIYDHLGELKKEFNLYVEGEDFKWQSSYPEPLWLGTIALEEAGKEPEAEPTPEEVIEIDLGQKRLAEYGEPPPELRMKSEPESMVAIEKVEEVSEKPSESVSGLLEKEPEEIKDAEALPEDPELELMAGYKKEVKDATKGTDRKRSRVKRSTPSASPGSFKELHQRYSPGDTSKGN